tara:strand:+ start:55241 stop:56107 length:867 start_codon:yes stop_codon:yes gene_type:complete
MKTQTLLATLLAFASLAACEDAAEPTYAPTTQAVGEAYLLLETGAPAFGFQIADETLVWAEPAPGQSSRIFATTLDAPDERFLLGKVDAFMPALGANDAYTLTLEGQLLKASLPDGTFSEIGIDMGQDFGQFHSTMIADDAIYHYRDTTLMRIDKATADIEILNMLPPDGFRGAHIVEAQGKHLLVRVRRIGTAEPSHLWFDIEKRSFSEVAPIEATTPSLTAPTLCSFDGYIACGSSLEDQVVIASPVDVADSIDAVYEADRVVWRESWNDNGQNHHGIFIAPVVGR